MGENITTVNTNIINTRFNVKNDNQHFVIHPETNGNMVVLEDGTTLTQFVNLVNQRFRNLETQISTINQVMNG